MKKIISLTTLCLVSAVFAGEHFWQMKDGTGNLTLKDESSTPVQLTIKTPEQVSWAREDDHGYFLTYSGGMVTAPAKDLKFQKGFTLDVKFSVDMQAKEAKTWMPLITCGVSYDKGYCVWINKDGRMLVTFNGTKSWYNTFRPGLRNRADHELKVVFGDGRVQITMDKRIVADFKNPGEIKYQANTFYVGSTPSWKYYGNIYHVKIKDFAPEDFFDKNKQAKVNGKVINPKYPADEIEPVKGISEPAGSVVLSDFTKFSPGVAIDGSISGDKFIFRANSGFFVPWSKGSLHSAEDAVGVEPLTYEPKLNGKYDVYLGVRANSAPTDFNFAINDFANPYRIQIGAAPSHRHPNTEILIEKDVDMSNAKLGFLPGGKMFVGYIKLIPSNNRRTVDYPQWNCVTVTRGQIPYEKTMRDEIAGKFASGYYTERFFVGNTRLPELSEFAKANGFIAFQGNWMELFFAHQVPEKDPGAAAITVTAARGEFEPAVLNLHALEDQQFSLAGGGELAKNGITAQIKVVRSMYKRNTAFYNRSEVINAPVWVEKTDNFQLAKNKSGQFWITFKVSPDAKAGSYQDHFLLSTAKGKVKIPVTVKVLPFELEKADRYIGFFPGRHGYTGAHETIREQAEHGMNTWIVDPSREMLWVVKEGKYQFDFQTNSAVIDTMKAVGMRGLIVRSDGILAKSGRNKENYKFLINLLNQEAARRGWPEPYYYTIDEVLSHPTLLPGTTWEMAVLKEINAKSWSTHIWLKTTRPLQKEVDALAPNIFAHALRFNTRNLWYVDDWQTIQDACNKSGKELWSYNIDNCLSHTQTAGYRFALGWFFRTVGKDCKGQMFYAYNNFTGSPYNDLDYDANDLVFSMPVRKFSKGGFTINYEAMREGVDDLRYIVTLEKRIAEAKKANINTESAEKVLKDLAASFDFGENFRKNSVFLDSKFAKQYDKNGKRYGEGEFNLPNGWKLADYQKAREAIAAEILKLDAQLKK